MGHQWLEQGSPHSVLGVANRWSELVHSLGRTMGSLSMKSPQSAEALARWLHGSMLQVAGRSVQHLFLANGAIRKSGEG